MSISGIGGASPFTTAGLMRLNALPETDPVEAVAGGLSGALAGAKSARDEFLDYAKMTPAEKMRAAMLARLGLKEEDVKAMDPDARKAVEAKIKEMVKQEFEAGLDKSPGKIVDMLA